MDVGSYVKQAVAALATAGLLAGSPATSSYRQSYSQGVSHSSQPSYALSRDRAPRSSSYGDNLVKWLDKSGYGKNDTLRSLFKSDIDDQAKYAFAMAFYDGLGSSKAVDKDEEVVHLVPQERGDGSFHYVNRMSGRIEVMVNRMPNGLFSYYGPLKWITRLGGRSELGGIRDSMADGKYFNKG